MNGFAVSANLKFVLLAAVMAGLWYLASPASATLQEQALWEKVRAAQLHLGEWRQANGTASDKESDPWGCGLVGVEWSAITTTLGDLEAKRTACNPAWSVRFSRWYREQGLVPGDRIAIYSSGSFPGLLLSALAAAEAMQLEPLLIVSLGASTWGANHPELPWPVLAAELRRAGFTRKRSDFYTLGGDEESGRGMAPEGEAALRKAAAASGVDLLEADNLAAMISLKADLLESHQARLLVNIGGSHANMGDDPAILKLQVGPISPGEASVAGNGVIAFALDSGIPVIHMLNIRALGSQAGIPHDSAPGRSAPAEARAGWSLLGLILFLTVLLAHRRWKLGSDNTA